MYDIAVNLPIYNEDKTISRVIDEWTDHLKDKNINFCIIFSEDGSTDSTKTILENYLDKNKIFINNIVEYRRGYSGAVTSGITFADSKYILCIDSDGQCDPKNFDSFWENRDSANIIMGYRNPRVDSLARKLYSFFCLKNIINYFLVKLLLIQVVRAYYLIKINLKN